MTFFESIIRLCDICFEKCKKFLFFGKFKWFILKAYQTFPSKSTRNLNQRIKLINIYFNVKFEIVLVQK